VSGRKHLVFVTQFGFYFPIRIRNEGVGLRFESADDDRRLAQQANEAGVAIDIIQTNEYIGSVLSHAIVAEQSGGQFSSLRVAQQQLARVDEGTRNGYVIGYVPANPKLDNQYRNVAVTVNRKNVTVTYRRGYRATENPGSIDPQEVYTRSRMREAVTGNIDLTDLPVRAQAVLATESGRKVVKFSITIDIQALELVDSGGRRTGELDLLVVVGDAQKNVIGKLDQHMTLAMPPALYQQARESGVPYTASVPVTGIPTIARIVAYHFDSDRLGTATVSVR
jgi:hypothetical protein